MRTFFALLGKCRDALRRRPPVDHYEAYLNELDKPRFAAPRIPVL